MGVDCDAVSGYGIEVTEEVADKLHRTSRMRFSDEKYMWYADTEKLAEKLANKTERQVQEILDEHDVIKLRSGKRPTVTFLGRITMLLLVVPFTIAAVIKWCATGDIYLDSWVKRSKLVTRLVTWAGIK